MSNLWINWRFGCRHLQIGPDFPFVRITFNAHHVKNKPKKFFQRY